MEVSGLSQIERKPGPDLNLPQLHDAGDATGKLEKGPAPVNFAATRASHCYPSSDFGRLLSENSRMDRIG